MPLSKARDKERKRQSRLESKGVQPKPSIYTEYERANPKICTHYELDADGQPIYDDS